MIEKCKNCQKIVKEFENFIKEQTILYETDKGSSFLVREDKLEEFVFKLKTKPLFLEQVKK